MAPSNAGNDVRLVPAAMAGTMALPARVVPLSRRINTLMPLPGRALVRKILCMSPDEAGFERRGFPALDSPARPHLEHIGRTFLEGYNAAMRHDRHGNLFGRLESVPSEYRGFAYEGAAMALAMLDVLSPWRGGRIDAFLHGPAADHVYMAHVGVGMAMARLRRDPDAAAARLTPLLRWLVLDGYGFHAGYFHWRRFCAGHEIPGRLHGYSRRVFDQGLGRSLWFVHGAQAGPIATAVQAFADGRRPDVWSGVGLACAYAGGAPPAQITLLREAAGACLGPLAQGAAFAAKARQRAGATTANTDAACRILCGMSADAAAAVTDHALTDIAQQGRSGDYESWRRQIQARCLHALGVSS